MSLSEGSTYSTYTTTNTTAAAGDGVKQGDNNGCRDPLAIEYGLSDKWGVGLNLGTDIYNVNPSSFYNFQTTTNNVKAFMSEFTLEANYHFFTADKIDLSGFVSLGLASVSINEKDGDAVNKYNAGGGIARIGAKGRYYLTRRLGVLAILSAFSANCSTKGDTGNTVANNYSTSIKGHALEFGLCYRILR